MLTVSHILGRKGRQVISMESTASVLDAARLMNEKGIGGVPVTESGSIVGIFTERDILRRVVAERRDPAATTLRDVMSQTVITCKLETTLDECISMMTDKLIRHLPVMSDAGICGILTAGDLLAFQLKDQAATIRYLQSHGFDVGGEGS